MWTCLHHWESPGPPLGPEPWPWAGFSKPDKTIIVSLSTCGTHSPWGHCIPAQWHNGSDVLGLLKLIRAQITAQQCPCAAQTGRALSSHPSQPLSEGWWRIAGRNQEWVPLPVEEMGVHCDTLSSEVMNWFLVNLVLSESVAIFLENKRNSLIFVPEECDIWQTALEEGAQWESKSGRTRWECSGSGVPHHENQNKSASL